MPKELFNQGTVDEPSGSDRFALSVPGAVGGKNFLYSKLKEIMRRGAADTWTASVINARPAIYQVGNYFYGLKDSVSLPFDSQVSPDLDSDNFTLIGEIAHNALAGRGAANSHPATAISVDSSGATGTMPTTVATVQEFFDAVDALVIPTSTYDIHFALSDEVSNLTTENDAQIVVWRNQTIESITFYVTTAPTGSNILVDVLKNGTTILTSKITLIAGTTSVTVTTPQLSNTSLSSGDVLKANITQIGVTIAGVGAKIFFKTKI